MTITANPLVASADVNVQALPGLAEFCERHGISPGLVRAMAYDVIDAPLLRFTLQERTPDGALIIDRRTKRAKTRDVEVALRGELPNWWEPTS